MRTVSGTAQSMTTRSCSARMCDWRAVEHQVEGERRPLARQLRVDVQQVAPGTEPAEPVGQRLPEPAHRGEVKTAGGGAGEIVEVEPGGHAKRHECPIGSPARASRAAWIAGDSELPCAVRGS